MSENAGTLADFERRAREFLELNVPRRSDSGTQDAHDPALFEQDQALQIRLHDAGFGTGMTQPKEYGGHGLGEGEALVWSRLSAEYAVPTITFAISHGMCGPIINLLGTPQQKMRYLPDLWRGVTVFAQMFSEPGAGSDVASLQTRAIRVDGGWEVTGQKVWTSNAQNCDYGVILARTNPDVPKHQGITMFIVALRDPAVLIRPLRVANGEYPFNEVFLDSLFVPDEDVLGEVNGGWAATLAMLSFERIALGTGSTKTVGAQSFASLWETARSSGLVTDPATRAALARVYVLEQGNELLSVRMREEAEQGIELGARGSIAKLAGAMANVQVNDIISDIAGLDLAAWEGESLEFPPLVKEYVSAPRFWSAGGTIEVQKNIIGDRVLGLEREPSVDHGVAFRDLRRTS